jgi:membrane dipeptidase
MIRRSLRLTRLVLVASLLPLAACGSIHGAELGDGPRADTTLHARAAAIHGRVLTVDTHVDIPVDFATPRADPGVRGRSQVDLPRMREGGLDAAFFVVYVGQRARTPENYHWARDAALRKFHGIRRMTYEQYPERIGLAYSAADVERIAREGRLVAAIGIENGFSVGRDLALLGEFHRLGARYAGLVHNGHNDIADSAQPRADLGDRAEEHGGLSEFGRAYVREANRLGMMVDVSHASKKATLQTARHSLAPVIASHSSVRAVADHPRNLDDEELRAIRENGGVVQITALDAFVKQQPPARSAAVRELRERLELTSPDAFDSLDRAAREVYVREMARIDGRYPRATVADFVDHIDHAVRTIGIDHVGISSDFDGGGGVVGWNHAGETPNVTLELVRRGYSEEEIAKLWGGNLLRVWRAVERVAAQMQAEAGPRR